MAEREIWPALQHELAAGRAGALLVVSEHRGSSPGRQGMLMAVSRHGPLAGTIGGGQAETTLVAAAQAALQAENLQPWRQTLIHHTTDSNASGMICGGQQTVVVGFWQPGQALPATGEPWSIIGDGWAYHHTPPRKFTACLIGGGHVSLALSRLLDRLDFRVQVFEERPGIATFVANTAAHEKHHTPYGSLADQVPEGDRVFVAIMTHSHERDAVALRALVGRPFGYLGLLGSRHKLKSLLAGEAQPDFLRAPMGLPIGSHTAEEIAVSIAAEMVAVRHAVAGNGG
ncbi:MAG: XdhC family protein [Dechloromonas agitata]|uniref:XdhC family protein n=1 Tax=Dechloromonas agitata TaxID=73030 RepID=A0A930G119_9RHOO|nr:XdhC/CoxI family protein [Dechloromonas agitata]MBF1164313.1 XdhC family protein [Dechloromonas agitata]